MFRAIKKLIESLNFIVPGSVTPENPSGTPIYPANVIVQAYQNNYAEPADGNFVVMTQLNGRDNGQPFYNYDADNETESFTALRHTKLQVDFYGKYAEDCCAKFRIALTAWYGSNFMNEYDATVAEVDDMINLTAPLDRDQYQIRHAVRFALFNNTSITLDDPGFTETEQNIYLAEVQADVN